MTPALMDALQVIILVLVAAGATVVVRAMDRIRQVLALSLYGVLLSVLFLAVQAPDVTLSEMVVGAVVLPLILLLTISKVSASGKVSAPRESGASRQGSAPQSDSAPQDKGRR